MIRAFACGLTVTVCLGLAQAADPSAGPRPLFSSVQPGPTGAPPRPAVFALSPETMTQALGHERDAYTRRLDACTQLRRIALETNNEALAARALELEQIAEETYRQRISRLGVKPELRTPANILDRTLGTGVAVTPLTVAKPEPASPAAPATAQLRKFREVPQQ